MIQAIAWISSVISALVGAFLLLLSIGYWPLIFAALSCFVFFAIANPSIRPKLKLFDRPLKVVAGLFGAVIFGIASLVLMTKFHSSNANAYAAQDYEQNCANGDFVACHDAGVAYEKGDGIAKDMQKAALNFTRACNGGDIRSCTAAGSIYMSEKGVPKDAHKAFGLFKKACDNNGIGGCMSLGLMYAYGDGVPKDYDKTLEYYKKSCKDDTNKICQRLHIRALTGAEMDANDAMTKTNMKIWNLETSDLMNALKPLKDKFYVKEYSEYNISPFAVVHKICGELAPIDQSSSGSSVGISKKFIFYSWLNGHGTLIFDEPAPRDHKMFQKMLKEDCSGDPYWLGSDQKIAFPVTGIN